MVARERAESLASRIAAETVARLEERIDPRRGAFTSGYFSTALRIPTGSICAALVGDRDPMVARALSWAPWALVPVDSGCAGLPGRARRRPPSPCETGGSEQA